MTMLIIACVSMCLNVALILTWFMKYRDTDTLIGAAEANAKSITDALVTVSHKHVEALNRIAQAENDVALTRTAVREANSRYDALRSGYNRAAKIAGSLLEVMGATYAMSGATIAAMRDELVAQFGDSPAVMEAASAGYYAEFSAEEGLPSDYTPTVLSTATSKSRSKMEIAARNIRLADAALKAERQLATTEETP